MEIHPPGGGEGISAEVIWGKAKRKRGKYTRKRKKGERKQKKGEINEKRGSKRIKINAK